MKNILVLILCFFSLTLLGQNLECCKTEKDVENYLSGKWKLKGSDSKTIYRYWVEKGKVRLEYYKSDDKEKGIHRTDNDAFIGIIKYENGFKLDYTYPFDSVTAELKHLDSEKLIVVRDGEEREYYKIEK